MGEKVRALRKARHWRQEDLAKRAEITFQTVSNLETGRHVPAMATLSKIAGALEVSLGDLL